MNRWEALHYEQEAYQMRHGRSFDSYTPAELRELSRKGGLASGAARRARRAAIEEAKIRDAALSEMRRENVRSIREATRLLKEAKHARHSKAERDLARDLERDPGIDYVAGKLD